MSSELTISTMSSGKRNGWLEECSESVLSRLPPGASYIIIPCKDSSLFQRTRWDSLHLSPLVSTVDDDYILDGDALNWCLQALQASGAGIAFTQVTGSGLKSLKYSDICRSGTYLYTAYILRRDCLLSAMFDKAQEFEVEIDWIVRAWVALRFGAVYIPFPGIHRRIHSKDRLYTEPKYWDKLSKHRVGIQQFLRSLRATDSVIPDYGPNSLPS